MKEFRSIEDVERACLPDQLARVVRGTLEGLIDAYAECGGLYDPDADGWTVLLEQGDSDDAIRNAIGGNGLQDTPFEGVSFKFGLFVAVWLANNQFGIALVIPDEPWLDPDVRARLMADCLGGCANEQAR
jgi:hypothetical protein